MGKEVVDQRVYVRFIDDTREFEVKEIVEAPPISLWKLGVMLLAVIGGSASAYYLTKGGER